LGPRRPGASRGAYRLAVQCTISTRNSYHTAAALYEVFPPAEARRMLRRLELHLTPVYGSCLHMAELELTVLTRQCLKRRIPDASTLAREAAAWEARRNCHHATIDWRFTTRDVRIKLKRLYQKYSTYSPLGISFALYAAEVRACCGSASFSARSGVNRGIGKTPASWRASRHAQTISSGLGAHCCRYQGR
jgi:hypothetical protein